MNQRAIVEKVSLSLLLTDTLDRAKLAPHITALRKLDLDSTSRALLEKFAAIVDGSTKSENPSIAQAEALAVWETLSVRMDGSTTQPSPKSAAKSETIEYDASHGREILNSFFSELGGHLQLVEEQMIRLESHCGDKDALNAVFGAMHSLKGIAGFLNVKIAHELAHDAEAVMELARKRDAGIEPAECDAILKTVDALRTIADSIFSHVENPKTPLPLVPASCGAILTELRRLARQGAAPAKAPAPTPTIAPVLSASKSRSLTI